jgi:hypothetical protein
MTDKDIEEIKELLKAILTALENINGNLVSLR